MQPSSSGAAATAPPAAPSAEGGPEGGSEASAARWVVDWGAAGPVLLFEGGPLLLLLLPALVESSGLDALMLSTLFKARASSWQCMSVVV